MSDPCRGRRRALMEQLADGLILVRGSGPEGLNPNFFYLTGVAEPRGALLLAPGGVRIGTGRQNPGPDYVHGTIAHQILFLPPGDPLAARWGEDAVATVMSTPADEVGVDAVLGIGELDAVLSTALGRGGALHVVRAASPALGAAGEADATYVARLQRAFFGNAFTDATPLVHEMRRSKDDAEIAAIERSIGVTAEAFGVVMREARAGIKEQELEAELTRVYRRHGGTHAFDPIVGGGRNALLLHYKENRDVIDAGVLVLVDTGASIDGYKADVTRTLPADGTFSPRQREVYETVLAALDAAIATCRPDALLGDIHATAFEVIDRAGFGEYFIHGTSHHLGLETHDVGDVHAPLQPGAVITVEPGIYLPEEAIGVRIEDDVLITADGHRNLSRDIPRTLEEVERACRR